MSTKTLLLTYCFPPMGIPEAFLCSKLLGNIPEGDITVHTTSSWKPWMQRDTSLLQYSQSRFSEINRFEIPRILQRFPLVKQDLLSNQSEKKQTLRRKALQFLTPLFVPLFRIPDPFRILNMFLLRSVLAKDFNYKNVVTWSQYHSVQLVGLRLKKRFGSSINWIAYFGDPWIGSPYIENNRLVESINLRLQTKVFNSADVLVFPTPEMLNFALDPYSDEIRGKGRVISHSFDPSLYPRSNERLREGKFVFRYIGQFYGIRTPEILYDSILNLLNKFPTMASEFAVEIIGNNSKFDFAYEKYLSLPTGMVTFRPQVNYVGSLEIMVNTDCLISIDAPSKLNIFLSAKVIDYIGAGRPIIAFTSPGATAALIEPYGGWVANSDDPFAGALAFETAIRWLRDVDTSNFGNPSVKSGYTVESVAQQFKVLFVE